MVEKDDLPCHIGASPELRSYNNFQGLKSGKCAKHGPKNSTAGPKP